MAADEGGPAQHTPAAAPATAASSGSYVEEVKSGIAQLRALFIAIESGELQGVPEDFECVRGRPGVRLEPIPWDELVALISDGSERALGSLGRSPLQLKEYWDYRDGVILRDFATVTDYLRVRVFGFDTKPAPDGRKLAIVPPGFFTGMPTTTIGIFDTEAAGTEAGSAGDIPANAGGESGSIGDATATCSSGSPSSSNGGLGTAPEGFQLVTKWRDNDFPYLVEPGIAHCNLWANRPLSSEEVEAEIARQVPAGSDVAWFVNPPSVQSVPAIWHCHIMFRPQQ